MNLLERLREHTPHANAQFTTDGRFCAGPHGEALADWPCEEALLLRCFEAGRDYLKQTRVWLDRDNGLPCEREQGRVDAYAAQVAAYDAWEARK